MVKFVDAKNGKDNFSEMNQSLFADEYSGFLTNFGVYVMDNHDHWLYIEKDATDEFTAISFDTYKRICDLLEVTEGEIFIRPFRDDEYILSIELV